MDADGYPEDEELEEMERWAYTDLQGLLDYVKERWWMGMADWGWNVDATHNKLHLSTGGWSGNESIISALQRNQMFWVLCWEQSRRGGHYIFDLKQVTKQQQPKT